VWPEIPSQTKSDEIPASEAEIGPDGRNNTCRLGMTEFFLMTIADPRQNRLTGLESA
jgi:hypothetical protein